MPRLQKVIQTILASVATKSLRPINSAATFFTSKIPRHLSVQTRVLCCIWKCNSYLIYGMEVGQQQTAHKFLEGSVLEPCCRITAACLTPYCSRLTQNSAGWSRAFQCRDKVLEPCCCNATACLTPLCSTSAAWQGKASGAGSLAWRKLLHSRLPALPAFQLPPPALSWAARGANRNLAGLEDRFVSLVHCFYHTSEQGEAGRGQHSLHSANRPGNQDEGVVQQKPLTAFHTGNSSVRSRQGAAGIIHPFPSHLCEGEQLPPMLLSEQGVWADLQEELWENIQIFYLPGESLPGVI